MGAARNGDNAGVTGVLDRASIVAARGGWGIWSDQGKGGVVDAPRPRRWIGEWRGDERAAVCAGLGSVVMSAELGAVAVLDKPCVEVGEDVVGGDGAVVVEVCGEIAAGVSVLCEPTVKE